MTGYYYIYKDLAHTTVCSVWDKGYRYGFNSMEKDNEVNVNGGSYDFGARIYDSRLGRWLSLDPLMGFYPCLSSYSYSANSTLNIIDIEGRYIKCLNEYSSEILLNTLNLTFGEGTFRVNSAGFIELNIEKHKINKTNYSTLQIIQFNKIISMLNSEYLHLFVALENNTPVDIPLTEVSQAGKYTIEDKEVLEGIYAELAVCVGNPIGIYRHKTTTITIVNVENIKKPLNLFEQQDETVTSFNIHSTIMHELLDHGLIFQKSKSKIIENISNPILEYNNTSEILNLPKRTGRNHDKNNIEGIDDPFFKEKNTTPSNQNDNIQYSV
ncbi:MAG: RHS repeat-associated core domain-containing protein [Bacteroidota bacterium]|nr:RHS repeat-associated core domain-containing protein [Bacteroidota bacterium]